MSKPEDIMKALAGVIGANDAEATVTHWLDSGFPPLNNASSSDWDACFPVGRVIEIAGPPSSGKTTISTKAMAAAQALGGVAAFFDYERSFSLKLAPRLGLDVEPGRLIYKKPETFEDGVAMFHLMVETIRTKKLIPDSAPICVVFDSLAAMTPQSTLYDSKGKRRAAGDRNMNDNTALARATSAHFAGIAQIAEKYNVCVIFLNQMRTKIGVMFGDPRKTTGGDSPEFYFSQRLWLTSSKIVDDKTKEVLGMEVSGIFMKNKVSRPFVKSKWRFMFQEDGTGRFDAERSLVEFLNERKLLPGKTPEGKDTKPGYYWWDGKQMTREQMARAVEAEGDVGFNKLKALLPAKYEAPVVAEAELNDVASVLGGNDVEDEAEAA
jgi:protein RecA